MKTGVAYFQARDVRHVERDLDEMLDNHCNMIIHCYSELDMAFYNRAMEQIVKMSKDRKMEVYLDPWALGGIYGGESFSRFVAENLSARQVNNRGDSVPAACVNQPAFRAFHKSWIKRASELGADVCFWDEPHFYFNILDPKSWGTWSCLCEECKRKFKEIYNMEMPTERTEEVLKFREKSVIEFLEEACDEAKEKGMRNCVCVLPDEGGGIGKMSGTSSWENIARIPSIDIFGTDPYWILFGKKIEDFVPAQSSRVVELCKKYGKEPQAWVLAFIIPEGREEEVGKAVEMIYNEGIRNIAAWAFRGNEVIDIKCKNPEKVWEILGDAFKNAHKKARKEAKSQE